MPECDIAGNVRTSDVFFKMNGIEVRVFGAVFIDYVA